MFGWDDPEALRDEISRLRTQIDEQNEELSSLRRKVTALSGIEGAVKVLKQFGAEVVETPPNPSDPQGKLTVTLDEYQPRRKR